MSAAQDIGFLLKSCIDKETAEALVARLEEKNPDIDVELQMGGQPIYYYLISAE